MMPENEKSKWSPEIILERIKLWQIIFGIIAYILGIITPYTPQIVNYMLTPAKQEINCQGEITITYPEPKTEVTGSMIDVTGTVKPVGKCRHIFLIVETLEGHKYWMISDVNIINPDGSWEAVAKLNHIQIGNRARIHARLCGKADAYNPEGCLEVGPSKGIPSNTVVVRKVPGG